MATNLYKNIHIFFERSTKMFNILYLLFFVIQSIQCTPSPKYIRQEILEQLKPIDSVIIFGSDNEYSDGDVWFSKRTEQFVTDQPSVHLPVLVTDNQPPSVHLTKQESLPSFNIPTPPTLPEHLYILDNCSPLMDQYQREIHCNIE